MAFTQQTFFGASIRDFSGSIGWGANPSSVTVRLVVDPSNGDAFVEPIMGQPALFDYSGWTFGGMVQNWELSGGSGGNPLYEIILVDPREILDGCAIILDGYTGSTFGVPNLFNVYGYLEAAGGFGSSNITSAGIPWRNVRDGLVALTQGANATYGDAISTAGFQYEIDLGALPNLPTAYRLPAQDTSIMEFIRNVCDAANHEFFFTHTPVGNTNFLKLFTIDRNVEPVFGAITNFILSTPGAVSKSSGFEFRNEVTSKFLVGGNLTDIFFQNAVGGGDGDFDTDPEDNTIWQYWGKDSAGDVIIGDGINDKHVMNLDSRWVPPWPHDNYPSSIGEMRAAVEGQASWEAYLWVNNFNYFLRDNDGSSTDVFRDPTILTNGTGKDHYQEKKHSDGTSVNYTHDNLINPHFGKADELKTAGGIAQETALIIFSATEEQLEKFSSDAVATFTKKSAQQNSGNQDTNSKQAEQATQVYRYVNNFASEYYGRKYMVRIPFIFTNIDAETGELQLSMQPVDSGFIEESLWPDAISNNLLPPDVNKISAPDGRILAYVKYDSAEDYDFDRIPEDSITMSADGDTAFILVDVDEAVAFLDSDTSFSPRAIITMPGAIRNKKGDDSKNYQGIVATALIDAYKHKDANANIEDIKDKVNKTFGGVAADNMKFANGGQALIMTAAGIPLQSNIETYGPWYSGGANGKLEFEADTSLVPWNYGGFTAMNTSAQAKVDAAVSQYQVSEAGTVQFPDVPAINMGSSLVGGGPFVTDVSVSIGDNGATTTYSMSTWTPQPYEMRKAQADFQSRAAVRAQRLRREYRELSKTPKKTFGKGGGGASIPQPKETPQNGPESTHTMIVGQVMLDPSSSGEFYKASVGVQPHYLQSTQLGNDYIDKAGATLDTLFYPFATSQGMAGSGIPYFELPEGDASSPNITDLNPFNKTTNYRAVTQGGSLQDIGNSDGEPMTNARGLALRAPIIVGGWGYNTDGNPVPANSGGSDFIADVNRKSGQWKVGPLDTRWDDSKKVWVATGGGGLIKAIASGDIGARQPNGTASLVGDASIVTVDNWLGPPICDGSKLYLSLNNGAYSIVQSEFNNLDVVTDIICDSGNVLSACVRTIYIPSAFSLQDCSGVIQ